MSLSDWRRRIDEIDRKLPLYQPERERQVLKNAESANPGPLSHAAIRRLFERIIDEARSIEREAMHQDGAPPKDSK